MATQRSKEAPKPTTPAPSNGKKEAKSIPIKNGKGKQVGLTDAETAGYPEGTERPKSITHGSKNAKSETPAAAGDDKEVPAKPKRKGAIEDEVSKFLADTKSNADAIAKTKKHEHFEFMNKKAWTKLIEQKDTLGGGLFRMRLGNMLRGARSKSVKMAEKAKNKAATAKAKA
jgi:hypothetical protein